MRLIIAYCLKREVARKHNQFLLPFARASAVRHHSQFGFCCLTLLVSRFGLRGFCKAGKEILQQVQGPIDGFCSGIGTGGTLTGVGSVLKSANPNIHIWAAEPENAAILSGGSIGSHIQMGIGDGIIPDILNQNIYNDIYVVTDEEALDTSRRLAREEGLMVGISAGTNVAAALKLAKKLGKGKTVVTVLTDTAERYFSTPLFME